MRRVARIARWELDDDGHRVRARRDERWLDLLQPDDGRLPIIRSCLLSGGHRLIVRVGITAIENEKRGPLAPEPGRPAHVLVSSCDATPRPATGCQRERLAATRQP